MAFDQKLGDRTAEDPTRNEAEGGESETDILGALSTRIGQWVGSLIAKSA